MGRGAAWAFAMEFLGALHKIKKAAGLRGTDRVTIWRDGTVADGRGEVIGTCMTKFDELPKVYATLRFAGNELYPAQISAVLPVAPMRAHRKGETFCAGPRAGKLIGRTGIWYFDTRDLASRDLGDHLRRIVELLYPEHGNVDRVNKLRNVMGREHATAHVSCFWFGAPGARPPTIPDDVRTALARLPAEIETDFHPA
jgi:hypothetical protein